MPKPLKLIQLNCFQFTYFDQILQFLKGQNADVINLQEATTGKVSEFNNGQYLEKLATELGLKIIYSPFTAKETQEGNMDWFGNAILTKLEIVDYGTQWLHEGQNKAGVVTYQDDKKLKDAIKINRNLAYPIVYNQPKNLVWALLKYDGKVFRNITTHFTATQKCTETLQMIQEAQAICDFIDNTKDIPTIFTGDLNIHQQAGVIQNLKSKLSLVNEGSVNSLTKSNHQIFTPKYQELDLGLKDGLSVDYVFQKSFKVNTWKILDVEISDHLPIAVEFAME
jgi:endonuclease/exonuclease/phosphatase family metal-dependent hydrolase